MNNSVSKFDRYSTTNILFKAYALIFINVKTKTSFKNNSFFNNKQKNKLEFIYSSLCFTSYYKGFSKFAISEFNINTFSYRTNIDSIYLTNKKIGFTKLTWYWIFKTMLQNKFIINYKEYRNASSSLKFKQYGLSLKNYEKNYNNWLFYSNKFTKNLETFMYPNRYSLYKNYSFFGKNAESDIHLKDLRDFTGFKFEDDAGLLRFYRKMVFTFKNKVRKRRRRSKLRSSPLIKYFRKKSKNFEKNTIDFKNKEFTKIYYPSYYSLIKKIKKYKKKYEKDLWNLHTSKNNYYSKISLDFVRLNMLRDYLREKSISLQKSYSYLLNDQFGEILHYLDYRYIFPKNTIEIFNNFDYFNQYYINKKDISKELDLESSGGYKILNNNDKFLVKSLGSNSYLLNRFKSGGLFKNLNKKCKTFNNKKKSKQIDINNNFKLSLKKKFRCTKKKLKNNIKKNGIEKKNKTDVSFFFKNNVNLKKNQKIKIKNLLKINFFYKSKLFFKNLINKNIFKLETIRFKMNALRLGQLISNIFMYTYLSKDFLKISKISRYSERLSISKSMVPYYIDNNRKNYLHMVKFLNKTRSKKKSFYRKVYKYIESKKKKEYFIKNRTYKNYIKTKKYQLVDKDSEIFKNSAKKVLGFAGMIINNNNRNAALVFSKVKGSATFDRVFSKESKSKVLKFRYRYLLSKFKYGYNKEFSHISGLSHFDKQSKRDINLINYYGFNTKNVYNLVSKISKNYNIPNKVILNRLKTNFYKYAYFVYSEKKLKKLKKSRKVPLYIKNGNSLNIRNKKNKLNAYKKKMDFLFEIARKARKEGNRDIKQNKFFILKLKQKRNYKNTLKKKKLFFRLGYLKIISSKLKVMRLKKILNLRNYFYKKKSGIITEWKYKKKLLISKSLFKYRLLRKKFNRKKIKNIVRVNNFFSINEKDNNFENLDVYIEENYKDCNKKDILLNISYLYLKSKSRIYKFKKIKKTINYNIGNLNSIVENFDIATNSPEYYSHFHFKYRFKKFNTNSTQKTFKKKKFKNQFISLLFNLKFLNYLYNNSTKKTNPSVLNINKKNKIFKENTKTDLNLLKNNFFYFNGLKLNNFYKILKFKTILNIRKKIQSEVVTKKYSNSINCKKYRNSNYSKIVNKNLINHVFDYFTKSNEFLSIDNYNLNENKKLFLKNLNITNILSKLNYNYNLFFNSHKFFGYEKNSELIFLPNVNYHKLIMKFSNYILNSKNTKISPKIQYLFNYFKEYKKLYELSSNSTLGKLGAVKLRKRYDWTRRYKKSDIKYLYNYNKNMYKLYNKVYRKAAKKIKRIKIKKIKLNKIKKIKLKNKNFSIKLSKLRKFKSKYIKSLKSLVAADSNLRGNLENFIGIRLINKIKLKLFKRKVYYSNTRRPSIVKNDFNLNMFFTLWKDINFKMSEIYKVRYRSIKYPTNLPRFKFWKRKMYYWEMKNRYVKKQYRQFATRRYPKFWYKVIRRKFPLKRRRKDWAFNFNRLLNGFYGFYTPTYWSKNTFYDTSINYLKGISTFSKPKRFNYLKKINLKYNMRTIDKALEITSGGFEPRVENKILKYIKYYGWRELSASKNIDKTYESRVSSIFQPNYSAKNTYIPLSELSRPQFKTWQKIYGRNKTKELKKVLVTLNKFNCKIYKKFKNKSNSEIGYHIFNIDRVTFINNSSIRNVGNYNLNSTFFNYSLLFKNSANKYKISSKLFKKNYALSDLRDVDNVRFNIATVWGRDYWDRRIRKVYKVFEHKMVQSLNSKYRSLWNFGSFSLTTLKSPCDKIVNMLKVHRKCNLTKKHTFTPILLNTKYKKIDYLNNRIHYHQFSNKVSKFYQKNLWIFHRLLVDFNISKKNNKFSIIKNKNNLNFNNVGNVSIV